MNEIQDIKRIDALFEKISELIEQARKHVSTTVNIAEVYTKYNIGRYIVEDEQQGEYRAQYGKQVLKNLSERLTERFGDGWSQETLKKCRFFYRVYSERLIGSTVSTQLPDLENGQQCGPNFTVSWSHYQILRNDKGLVPVIIHQEVTRTHAAQRCVGPFFSNIL